MGSLLPIKRELTLVYLGSLLIALPMTIASVVGLLFQAQLYPEKQLFSFASTDGSNLLIVLPTGLDVMHKLSSRFVKAFLLSR